MALHRDAPRCRLEPDSPLSAVRGAHEAEGLRAAASCSSVATAPSPVLERPRPGGGARPASPAGNQRATRFYLGLRRDRSIHDGILGGLHRGLEERRQVTNLLGTNAAGWTWRWPAWAQGRGSRPASAPRPRRLTNQGLLHFDGVAELAAGIRQALPSSPRTLVSRRHLAGNTCSARRSAAIAEAGGAAATLLPGGCSTYTRTSPLWNATGSASAAADTR